MEQNNEYNEIREEVSKKYKHLISSLNSIYSKLNKINFTEKELVDVKKKFLSQLKKIITEIDKEATYRINNTCWDSLTIGFFGETNAGKSTIIESLRILLNEESREKARKRSFIRRLFSRKKFNSTDGLIVGDGRHDFTKEYHEYKMTINEKKFTLIDVPGIEGNEKEYKDGIREALTKAHIIFYVNGHNKNADKGTATKIVDYLSDNVKVYVIYNVRGSVEQYEFKEDRVSLMTDGNRKVISLLDSSFRNWIGSNFDGVIPVQGLLSMCAYADFSPKRKDLRKKQIKVFEFFNESGNLSREETAILISRFSNVDSLLNLIKRKSDNYIYEIRKANYIKIHSFGQRVVNEITTHIKSEEGKFNSFINRIKDFQQSNLNEANGLIGSLEMSLKAKSSNLIEQLRKNVLTAIDNNNSEIIKNLDETFNEDLSKVIDELIGSVIFNLSQGIKSRKKGLNGIPGLSINRLKFDIPPSMFKQINTDSIDDENDISAGDVVQTGWGAAKGARTGVILGSYIPVVGNVIGGIVGGIVGFFSGVFGSASNQYDRAKKEANMQIDEKKRVINNNLKSVVDKLRTALLSSVSDLNQSAGNTLNQLNNYQMGLMKAQNEIKSILTSINDVR